MNRDVMLMQLRGGGGAVERAASAMITAWLLLVASPIAAEPADVEPFGAEDHAAEDDPVHIPEPLVFDLVRGLGAQQGELDINALVQVPLEGSDPGTRGRR